MAEGGLPSLGDWVSEAESLIHATQSVTSSPLLPLLPPNLTDAYIPQAVSFGPRYHLKLHQLSCMERHKIATCRGLILHGGLNEGFGAIVERVKQKDLEVRNFYGIPAVQDSIYNEHTLSLMMTTDALFILDFMYEILWRKNPRIDGPQISYFQMQILTDVVKLQNQLPASVMEEVLQMYMKNRTIDIDSFMRRVPLCLSPFYFVNNSGAAIEGPMEAPTHVLDMLCNYVSRFLQINVQEMDIEFKFYEFFDAKLGRWRRWFLLPVVVVFPIYILWSPVSACINKIIEKIEDSRPIASRISKAIRVVHRVPEGAFYVLFIIVGLPLIIWAAFAAYVDLRRARRAIRTSFPQVCTATKLYKVGVDFEALCEDTDQITLRNDILFLPTIMISKDTTEVIMRNLLALESFGRPDKPQIVTTYVDLMATLIDSAKDVALLRRVGIIYSQEDSLTNAEIARMWKCLLKPFFAAYFKPPQQLVKWLWLLTLRRKRSSNIWKIGHPEWLLPEYWEEFKERYLSKPWLTASLVGGILLVLMTAAQVFCLFYQCSFKH